MRHIILACAIAGVLAVPAKAQSLRDQLVGAWEFVSCDPNSVLAEACGTNPNGVHFLDASGHYTTIIAARGRSGANARRASPAEEIKAIAVKFLANFGTWSVNEADRTISYHIQGALYPNAEGQDGSVTITSVSENELKLGQTVYRRIRK